MLRGEAILPLPAAIVGRLSDPQPLAIPRHAGGSCLRDGELRTSCAGRSPSADQSASVRHVVVQLAALISARLAGSGSASASISSMVAIWRISPPKRPGWSASTARRRRLHLPPAVRSARWARPFTRFRPDLPAASGRVLVGADAARAGIVRRLSPSAGRPLPRPRRNRERNCRADADQVDAGTPRLLASSPASQASTRSKCAFQSGAR